MPRTRTLRVVIDTGNPVINDGALEASGGGDLVIQDPLDNDGGTISIQDGNVELAVSNSLTVNFSGTGGTLQLDNTVTGGASAGVDATSTGTAAIIITSIGSVSSTGAEGIEATSAGGNISITPEGSVDWDNRCRRYARRERQHHDHRGRRRWHHHYGHGVLRNPRLELGLG